MTSKQKQVLRTEEALSVYDTLKLALEALETAWYHVFCPTDKAIELYDDARAAIKAALEAHKALMSVSDGAQPAVAEQHKQSTPCGEPVAWAMLHDNGDFIDAINPEEHARIEGDYKHALYTAPPTQQGCSQRAAAAGEDTRRAWVHATTWRGLTVEDKMAFLAQDFGGNRLDAMDWAEERLKEKNT